VDSVVVVRPLPSGRWRWHFIDEASGVSLASNHTFDDVDSAERSARAAYPELTIGRVGAAGADGALSSGKEAGSDRKSGSRWLRFLGVGLILFVLVAVLAPASAGRSAN
jgi:hypothetical protein